MKRIDSMQTETLTEYIINTGQSERRKQVNELAEELNAKIQMPVLAKNSLKTKPTRRDKRKTNGWNWERDRREDKDQTLERDENRYASG